jgi:hypothetical protein
MLASAFQYFSDRLLDLFSYDWKVADDLLSLFCQGEGFAGPVSEAFHPSLSLHGV